MPSDPILDRFKDLVDKDWPGRRPPVNRSTPPALPLSVAWDERPMHFHFMGQEREFFSIRHLACALGVAQVTIRKWEDKGILPRSLYRSPRPRAETIPGREAKGRRLWLRQQIEGLLVICREEDVILNGRTPTERFTARVAAMFLEVHQRLINGELNDANSE